MGLKVTCMMTLLKAAAMKTEFYIVDFCEGLYAFYFIIAAAFVLYC